MKKLLTILLTFVSLIIYTQDFEPIYYKQDFYDTLKFRKPFILQNGDTCEIFVMNNDSIVMVCNSLDTLRIDFRIVVSDDVYNATSWNGNQDAATKNAIRDKIETLGGGHDPVTLTGTPEYLTLSGQEITRDSIDLVNDVKGNLPVTNLNSGTGASSSKYWSGSGTWTKPDSSNNVVTANDSLLADTVKTNEIQGLDSDTTNINTTVDFLQGIRANAQQVTFSVDMDISFKTAHARYVTITNNCNLSVIGEDIPEGITVKLWVTYTGSFTVTIDGGITQMTGNESTLQETNGAYDLMQFEKRPFDNEIRYVIINDYTP
jgi:hypothetical protein